MRFEICHLVLLPTKSSFEKAPIYKIILILGNLIEWSIPDDVDIKGVEFKALVSGSHTITQDFV